MVTSQFRLPFGAILVLFLAGCDQPSRSTLPQKLHIEVTGKDFEWYVRYAGPDGTLGTADDHLSQKNITLLAGVDTIIDLKSDDYLYSFALPHLGLKEIVVPDLFFSLQFSPEETGDFQLKGDQLCGYQHPNLLGKVHVLAPDEFLRWLNHQAHHDGD